MYRLDPFHAPDGYMSEMDEREKNTALALSIVQGFEQKAVNGGKLELEIDRYGHVRCTVTINPSSRVA